MNAVMKMKSPGKNQLCHRIRGAVDGYAAGIVRLIAEHYGTYTLQQAWREFTLGDARQFQCGDPHAELFFSWLFHCWSPTREKGSRVDDCALYGVQPTRAYLDRNSDKLNPLLRRYLETCLVTSPRFYQVSNCKPNVGFGAIDLISGAKCVVSEELASASLMDGDIMFAHLVQVDGTTMLEAISPVCFPSGIKRHLKLLCATCACGAPGLELRALYFALAHSELCGPKTTLH